MMMTMMMTMTMMMMMMIDNNDYIDESDNGREPLRDPAPFFAMWALSHSKFVCEAF